MRIRIDPSPLSGTVFPPPSKSQTHRAILAAALAEGCSLIRNVTLSQDIAATLRCVQNFGCCWNRNGYALEIAGTSGEKLTPGELVYCDCGESGSTLRFLIPIALALAGGGYFVGEGQLMERPLGPYFDIFDEKGIFYERKDGALTVRGRLAPGTYRLPGNVSSQFVTGLLFALPLLEGDSEIVLTSRLESRGYVFMTLNILKAFGIQAKWENNSVLLIPGRQKYQPCDLTIEADWSQAAFWYAAQGIGSSLTIQGMDNASIQGDRVILDYGAMLRGEPPRGGVTVPVWGSAKPCQAQRAPQRPGWRTPCVGNVSLDISHCPDLAPPLAAWGALLNGALYLENAARLRLKESDRLATITAGLKALGAEVYEEPNRLAIVGKPSLPGGTVDSANDHRIAMMAAVAATRCTGPVTILGAECVEKSYPNFWEEYKRLGGKPDVL